MNSSAFLDNFVRELKARGALPKQIELSRLGPVHMAGLYDELASNIITESVFTGMDVDPDLAVIKALVEMIERRAFLEGRAKGYGSCQTRRSDGFAAFPHGTNKDAPSKARENALHEAIERFSWATWWDKREINHDVREIVPSEDTAMGAMLLALSGLVPIRKIFCIYPRISNASEITTSIHFAFLDPVGIISGGACGKTTNAEVVAFRGVCELVRHGLAAKRMVENDIAPTTFYERRLSYFASTSEGTNLARDRIFGRGLLPITLPELAIDHAVPHALSDLVHVHRCYFDNQPAFVGGALERLCL